MTNNRRRPTLEAKAVNPGEMEKTIEQRLGTSAPQTLETWQSGIFGYPDGETVTKLKNY